jgi:hypothetical protein
VGDEDDRLLDLLLQAQELVLQAVAGNGVDRAERLVHQHHVGVGAHRACDTDPLTLTAGQLLGVAVAVLARVHPDHLQKLIDPFGDALLLPVQHLGNRGDVAGDRDVGEEPDLLDDIADPAAQLVGVDLGDVLAVEEDPPGGGFDDPVDHLHGRRLAAAGRTDQDDDLALGDLHRQILDGDLLLSGEPLGEVLQPDRDRAAIWCGAGVGCCGVLGVGHLRPFETVRREITT